MLRQCILKNTVHVMLNFAYCSFRLVFVKYNQRYVSFSLFPYYVNQGALFFSFIFFVIPVEEDSISLL